MLSRYPSFAWQRCGPSNSTNTPARAALRLRQAQISVVIRDRAAENEEQADSAHASFASCIPPSGCAITLSGKYFIQRASWRLGPRDKRPVTCQLAIPDANDIFSLSVLLSFCPLPLHPAPTSESSFHRPDHEPREKRATPVKALSKT
ncbi:uncharacterized protein CLUP02_05892 [Colletotrichum lupini]|uniref:Uncharacterized protein n=1 Tax=Colletotrichum lupini TaxID=145971 RepID=A0A9Q8WEH5_9PEZI|nr:uncharacterized protein CLUP02_05892 [Colletotrichum lupini]UQC80409.1 hypothetical protein CLUP02_05892 [Colletotrichum lupini]